MAPAPIYVYGFCPRPPSGLTLPEGITQGTTVVVVDAIGAIAEMGIDLAPLQDDDQKLMAAVLSHDQVLQRVFAQTDVLPLRFGTQFADAEALHRYLQIHQGQHLNTLAALHDKAEYCVSLTPKPLTLPPLAPDLKGRDYFAAKKQRLQTQSDRQHHQHQQLETLLATWQQQGLTLHRGTPQAGTERLYVLASRQPSALSHPLSTAQTLAPDWDIQVSAPLPPYHFVD
jgi:hypothetical protein